MVIILINIILSKWMKPNSDINMKNKCEKQMVGHPSSSQFWHVPLSELSLEALA